MHSKPNVLFIFADQWRYQSFGYTGNAQVKTPNIDAFARSSINVSNAISGCPVCTPYRASLMTGQLPLTHGAFLNDVAPRLTGPTLAESFADAGYDTAYVGKWHIDGSGDRKGFIPRERRMGFDYWKVLQCTHQYNDSKYYAGDDPELKTWDGYDAIAQTNDLMSYLSERDSSRPFFAMLSWGPPHAPYQTAPEQYRAMYDPAEIELPANVHESVADSAREDLAGYYAHCTALDDCFGVIVAKLHELELFDETIVVFTSDHGDMIGSQGVLKKQKPWAESVRVPFLYSYPAMDGWQPREIDDAFIDSHDLMPTLLGACDLIVPDAVEGTDYSGYLEGGSHPGEPSGVYACYHPFGQWIRGRQGGPNGFSGREARGLLTKRYTYVIDRNGPWLLYDNKNDPDQLENLVGTESAAEHVREFDAKLRARLAARGDEFLEGIEYVRKFGYEVDPETLTAPYKV